MRVDAAPDVTASARAGGNGRVRIRIGVHRFTATVDEARALATQITNVVEATGLMSTEERPAPPAMPESPPST